MCDLQTGGKSSGIGHGNTSTRRNCSHCQGGSRRHLPGLRRYYLEETVARKVYAQAEEALKRHNEVEILQYAA